jgi:hypothetical protein
MLGERGIGGAGRSGCACEGLDRAALRTDRKDVRP